MRLVHDRIRYIYIFFLNIFGCFISPSVFARDGSGIAPAHKSCSIKKVRHTTCNLQLFFFSSQRHLLPGGGGGGGGSTKQSFQTL